jgi:hypothetical protein
MMDSAEIRDWFTSVRRFAAIVALNRALVSSRLAFAHFPSLHVRVELRDVLTWTDRVLKIAR